MRFRDLSPAARLYVLAVYASAALLIEAQAHYSDEDSLLNSAGVETASLWIVGLLTCGAALAHSFPVSSPDRQSYHVSPPLFLAGVILLEPLQLSVLMVVANVAERFRRRRSWFAQVFNVAAFVLTAAAAQNVFRVLSGGAAVPLSAQSGASAFVAGFAAIITFMAVNHGLVSVAVWLGNGIPPHAQRLLKWQTAATELLLLSMGIPLAVLAAYQPWAVVLGAAPLLLIYRALELPDALAQRRRDGLTDLFSAEYLAEACEREISRAAAGGRPLSALVVNVDGLARINNAYGRQEGDSLLRGVAHRLLQAIRRYDIAGRLGGGELGVILPDCGSVVALAMAHDICHAVESAPHEVQGSIEPLAASVTVGIASAPHGDCSGSALFAAARAAVIQARQSAGNCFVRVLTPRGHQPLTAEAPPVSSGAGNFAPSDDQASARRAASGTLGDQSVAQPSFLRGMGDIALRSFAHAADAAGPRRAMIALQVLVGLAAALTVASAVPHAGSLDPLAIVLLWGLVLMADLRSFELFGGSTFAVSVVPHIAAGMLMGPAGAIAVAPLSGLVRGIYRRSRWYKIVLNCNVYVIAAGSAAHVFQRLAQPLAVDQLFALLVPAALAGTAYYLHTLVIAAAMGTELRSNPVAIWKEQFRWLWPHYLVLSGLALLLALGYAGFGVAGGAIFLVPTLMMHFVAKQYINRTLVNVRQLRTLNEQLRTEIAQRVAAEHEISRLAEVAARTAALEELNRLKNDFISVASHELRTPMTTIMGFSEILLDSPGQRDHEMISLIHEEAVYLSALVDNLLDVSRIEGGRISIEPVAIDLSDTVLPPLLHALGASASRHRLTANVPSDACWVHADRTKLNQILTNLIGNAIKYSPDGGQIHVDVRPETATGMVVISITDQGMGIDADQLDRIFERFYRIERAETRGIGGTGLGLFISRYLAELHGGRLWAESEPACGSTFHLTLPAAVPHEVTRRSGQFRQQERTAAAA
jgi:diguanylate cyclase (GGDEF)-like protein